MHLAKDALRRTSAPARKQHKAARVEFRPDGRYNPQPGTEQREGPDLTRQNFLVAMKAPLVGYEDI